jgi:hypothetical protein
MEMKLANKESKSILAKLLASENLTVEHGKFNTASFDVKNRVLRLPIWKEMSGSLYDLLVLHEVGHALFTPAEGFHDAAGYGKGFKSYLNVVEDARIERKIKVKFPGGRRSFVKGYNDLMDRDFFGLSRCNMEELNLIDKINLWYKVGDKFSSKLDFSTEEQVFIDRIDKAETWKTVVEISTDLYEYAKENESDTDMSDHSYDNLMDDDDDENWEEEEGSEDQEKSEEDSEKSNDYDSEDTDDDEEENDTDFSNSKKSEEENGENSPETDVAGEGEEGGMNGQYSPESMTDRNFRNNESELVSDEAKTYKYLNIPTNIDLKNIIVDYTELYEEYRKEWFDSERSRYSSHSGEQQKTGALKLFNTFRSENKKVVEYLAKEFEMKKAAKEYSRSATANSGILSSEKLYTYKYNEHIFKKLTVTPDGKNHGLLMWVDWSGSMSQNMKGTIEQMMVLVMFCKRVNIPFEVYAFTDNFHRNNNTRDGMSSEHHIFEPSKMTAGDIVVPGFSLMNLFSSKMKSKQLHEAYIYMIATAHSFTSRWGYDRDDSTPYFNIPNKMQLGGTPLNAALLVSFSIMREFQKKNQVDVINSIFLTDGDSHTRNNYWKSDLTVGHFDIDSENVIIRDSISKKQISVTSNTTRGGRRRTLTTALVQFSREVFDINIVNFFLIPRMRKWEMMDHLDEINSGNDSQMRYVEAETELKKFRKEKYLITPEMRGFNEQYLILGGKHLEIKDEELTIVEDATVAQMTRAFKKFSSGKLEKRRLLSRFIGMIAA